MELQSQNTPTQSRLIRVKEATQKTGMSKSSIYDLMSKNQFPKVVRLSARSVAFIESEIDEWIACRIADRDMAKLA